MQLVRTRFLFSRTTSRAYFPFIALISVLFVKSLAASEKIQVGYRNFPYPEDTGSNSRPTGEKPESKLWFNDGVWWGVLWTTPANDCLDENNEPLGCYRIHWLDNATQTWLDAGTTVDLRSKSRADVLWDPTAVDTTHPDGTLYVASHVYTGKGAPVTKDSDRGRLYRFSYNAGTKTYILDAGFPVLVTGGKSETLVLAKDSTGQLWVTYVESNQVMVNHSLNGDDRTWATPFVLPGAKALEFPASEDGTDDIASIIAYDGHVGVMWSRQTYNKSVKNEHLASITMNYAVHDDGAAPSAWTSNAVYTSSGDDHINLKAYDGYLYAAIKTAGDAKVIDLLACKTQSSGCRKKSDWRRYPVFKTKDNSGNSPQADLKELSQPNPTRPILLIDTGNRDLYIFASVEQFAQSTINYKKTKLDAIRFDPKDPGVPFIRSTTDLIINDPTSTKQNLNSTTGLVVLASDEEAFHYFHNDLALALNPQ
jgi:hypothetical protein